MITTNLTTLKINKLTKAQYDAALAAGMVSENELYMTPESGAIEEIQLNGITVPTAEGVVNIVLSDYSTTKQMNAAISAAISNAIATSY